MKRRPQTPVFLPQSNYRHRRLRDAARIFPFVALVLWCIPLAWPTAGGDDRIGSAGVIYVFGVWVFVIVVSALLTGIMQRSTGANGSGDDST
jgi:hypothetical protein